MNRHGGCHYCCSPHLSDATREERVCEERTTDCVLSQRMDVFVSKTMFF